MINRKRRQRSDHMQLIPRLFESPQIVLTNTGNSFCSVDGPFITNPTLENKMNSYNCTTKNNYRYQHDMQCDISLLRMKLQSNKHHWGRMSSYGGQGINHLSKRVFFILMFMMPTIYTFSSTNWCRTNSFIPSRSLRTNIRIPLLHTTRWSIVVLSTTVENNTPFPENSISGRNTTVIIERNDDDVLQESKESTSDTSMNETILLLQSSPTSADVFIQQQQPYDHVRNIDGSYTVRYVSDDGLQIYEDNQSAKQTTLSSSSSETIDDLQQNGATTTILKPTDVPLEQKLPTINPSFFQNNQQQGTIPHNRIIETSAFSTIIPSTGFNVVLTHCTADFDSLASAVGLAKLWSSNSHTTEGTDSINDNPNGTTSIAPSTNQNKSFDSSSHVPTYVVLPRGAHPGVQRFLGLHKHLFPIRSLKSILSSDHISSLNRLALVDAQRRDRLGPAEPLLQYAKRITVVDHHIDQDSDIIANDYVVDQVGSVSTIIVERLQQAMISSPGKIQLTEAEATLLALGVHADTGNLCFDSTTVRDAYALAWCISQGASQTAIAEHGQSSLSTEQQGVLTQALINANSTVVHGVTIATVLLQADGFINGLAAVTQDALELSSSDVFILGLVYHAKSGSGSRKSKKGTLLTTHLLSKENGNASPANKTSAAYDEAAMVLYAEAWQGGEEALRRRRLRVAFDRTDVDGSGFLEENEIATSLASSGLMALPDTATADLIKEIDTDGNGKIDFEEFVAFATEAEKRQKERNTRLGRKGTTMIIIGRVKAGVNMKSVKLNELLEQFGGGGHAKAASATVRLNDESEAEGILQSLVDQLISTNLNEQPTVGDFMTSPVLSVSPHMTEKQVEDLFTRYDVRAFPVVDENNDVVGLVSYQLTMAAQQRLRNKEQKRLRQELDALEKGVPIPSFDEKAASERSKSSSVKAWMIRNVQIVEESKTLAEVEAIFLENDIGCIPVVADGTRRLVGMVTRTDLLRQHRYYPSLTYHNKGFADSIAARKPIIELRKKLKQFDLD